MGLLARQQKQLLAAVAKSRGKVRAEIETATQQLEQLLHKYTSFDLVGHLLRKHATFNMENYKETESARLHRAWPDVCSLEQ